MAKKTITKTQKVPAQKPTKASKDVSGKKKSIGKKASPKAPVGVQKKIVKPKTAKKSPRVEKKTIQKPTKTLKKKGLTAEEKAEKLTKKQKMVRLIAASQADKEEDEDVNAMFPLVAEIEEEEQAIEILTAAVRDQRRHPDTVAQVMRKWKQNKMKRRSATSQLLSIDDETDEVELKKKVNNLVQKGEMSKEDAAKAIKQFKRDQRRKFKRGMTKLANKECPRCGDTFHLEEDCPSKNFTSMDFAPRSDEPQLATADDVEKPSATAVKWAKDSGDVDDALFEFELPKKIKIDRPVDAPVHVDPPKTVTKRKIVYFK